MSRRFPSKIRMKKNFDSRDTIVNLFSDFSKEPIASCHKLSPSEQDFMGLYHQLVDDLCKSSSDWVISQLSDLSKPLQFASKDLEYQFTAEYNFIYKDELLTAVVRPVLNKDVQPTGVEIVFFKTAENEPLYTEVIYPTVESLLLGQETMLRTVWQTVLNFVVGESILKPFEFDILSIDNDKLKSIVSIKTGYGDIAEVFVKRIRGKGRNAIINVGYTVSSDSSASGSININYAEYYKHACATNL